MSMRTFSIEQWGAVIREEFLHSAYCGIFASKYPSIKMKPLRKFRGSMLGVNYISFFVSDSTENIVESIRYYYDKKLVSFSGYEDTRRGFISSSKEEHYTQNLNSIDIYHNGESYKNLYIKEGYKCLYFDKFNPEPTVESFFSAMEEIEKEYIPVALEIFSCWYDGDKCNE